MSHTTTDALLADLKAVVHDAEELLRATAGQAGEHIAQARSRAEASLRSAREQLGSIAAATTARARDAAQCADGMVRQNPWLAIGAGAAVGLLVGVVLGRRSGGGSR